MDDRVHSGFTLIDLLVTLAVAAILVTVALPAFSDLLDNQRLRNTAQQIATDLRYARSEAIKRHADMPIGVSFSPGSDWCYGISQQLPCDCHIQDQLSPNACLLDLAHERQLHTSATDSRAYIELYDTSFSSNQTQFDPLRGIATGGTVKLRSTRGKQLNVVVSILGRVRICAPTGSVSPSGYAPC